jgi:hypothetical protein
MAAMRGMDVTVLRPEGFELPEPVMTKALRAAAASGGSIRETADRREAMEGAHVIYAKSWSSVQHYGNKNADQDFDLARPEARCGFCWARSTMDREFENLRRELSCIARGRRRLSAGGSQECSSEVQP